MKKFYTLLITVFCLFSYQHASARHCAGGELVYRWISDSTYRFTFKFYYFCNGQTEAPANVPLCYVNTCTNSFNTITLQKITTLPDGSSNGTQVSTGCSGYQTKCDDPGSTTLPDGYREYYYEADITLPQRCADWRFSVSISARNQSLNLAGGSSNLFFVETTLNNIIAQGNSSPTFSVKPVPFVCINNTYTYNNGVFDADGDSLAYEILQPSEGSCGGSGTPIAFSSAAYNTTNNPFPTGNTFSIDPVTGQLNFTPTITGAFTLTLNIREYRNHIQIGNAMRDIQIQVRPCNSVQPTFIPDSLNITGGQRVNGRTEVCAGTPLHFCYKVKSPNAGAILVASDNHAIVAAGAAVTYTGQRTDSIQGCFSWTPGSNDSGLHNFAVTVKDSTCIAGIAISQTFVLPIYVYSTTNIDRDTTICAGSSVALRASGGTAFIWSVLPGGSPLSTLSCTNCSNPVATPAVTTRYVATSNLTSFCNKSVDTVLITVNQLPAPPQIISNSPVCVGDSLRMNSSVSAGTYEWTGPAGFYSTIRNPLIANAQTPNTGTYRLVIKNGSCASPAVTATLTVKRTPGLPEITGDSIVCEGSPIRLTASAFAGTYRWTGPGGFTASTASFSLPDATPARSGIYQVIAYDGNSFSCPSPQASYNVTIAPRIDSSFSFSRMNICVGDTVSVFSTGAGITTYAWNFDGGLPESGSGAGPYAVRYNTGGVKYITLIASNGGCTDSLQRMLTVHALPSSDFTVQPEACLDEPVRVKAKDNVSVDYGVNWDFAGGQVRDGIRTGPYFVSYSTPGEKTIRLITQSEYCTSAVTAKTVYVHPLPEARILSASQNNICAGDPVRFTAVQHTNYSYQWTPAPFFIGNGPVADARITTTGYVVLTVSDSLGCLASDSVKIDTKPCCTVTMPNAFTPNGDGRNDVFRMVTEGNPLNSRMMVLNRWGQTIFDTGTPTTGWDGTWNGRQLDAGTYYYYVKYQCTDGGRYELKGEVILMR